MSMFHEQHPMESRVGEQLQLSPTCIQPSCEIRTWFTPSWVMPMTFKICHGIGPAECINGMGIDSEGDLLLYRKITTQDLVLYPELVGVDEVWIAVKIPCAD